MTTEDTQMQTEAADMVSTTEVCVAETQLAPARRWRERGMVTIEYALGAVLVIALVGVIVVAIKQGFMNDLTKDFVGFIFQQIKTAFGVK